MDDESDLTVNQLCLAGYIIEIIIEIFTNYLPPEKLKDSYSVMYQELIKKKNVQDIDTLRADFTDRIEKLQKNIIAFY